MLHFAATACLKWEGVPGRCAGLRLFPAHSSDGQLPDVHEFQTGTQSLGDVVPEGFESETHGISLG